MRGVDQPAQVVGLGQVGLGGQRPLDLVERGVVWPRPKYSPASSRRTAARRSASVWSDAVRGSVGAVAAGGRRCAAASSACRRPARAASRQQRRSDCDRASRSARAPPACDDRNRPRARARRWRARVRSCTSPASWPQAASMSSPRVLRTVVTMPASCSTLAKAQHPLGRRAQQPDAGKRVERDQVELARHDAAAAHQPRPARRACAGVSLTPSSMQYSKVMKSRGAASR